MAFIYFYFPGNESLTRQLAEKNRGLSGEAEIRRFPDGESYIRINTNVRNQKVIIVCSLHQPDDKLVPLYLLTSALRDQGAGAIYLISPYLPYLRQDKIFKPGECLSSRQFARLLSAIVDGLITVDPHLHRIKNLDEIYSIRTKAVSCAEIISQWIKQNVADAIIIGPDSESEQWAATVAKGAGAPFTILEKVRLGDREVDISIPRISEYSDRTPVLVDDIISTGKTMAGTILQLKKLRLKPPVCIGIHAVFSGDAYGELLAAGPARVVTCNTIPHVSNGIEVLGLLAGCEHFFDA